MSKLEEKMKQNFQIQAKIKRTKKNKKATN